MSDDKKKKRSKMPVPFKAPGGNVKGIGPKGQFTGGLQPGIIGGPPLSPSATSVILRVPNSRKGK